MLTIPISEDSYKKLQEIASNNGYPIDYVISLLVDEAYTHLFSIPDNIANFASLIHIPSPFLALASTHKDFLPFLKVLPPTDYYTYHIRKNYVDLYIHVFHHTNRWLCVSIPKDASIDYAINLILRRVYNEC